MSIRDVWMNRGSQTHHHVKRHVPVRERSGAPSPCGEFREHPIGRLDPELPDCSVEDASIRCHHVEDDFLLSLQGPLDSPPLVASSGGLKGNEGEKDLEILGRCGQLGGRRDRPDDGLELAALHLPDLILERVRVDIRDPDVQPIEVFFMSEGARFDRVPPTISKKDRVQQPIGVRESAEIMLRCEVVVVFLVHCPILATLVKFVR